MSPSPAVSIVLPVHNGQDYLEQSIDSILSQKFTDFEVLVLDDESADETPNIVAKYGDERIRYSRNQGRFGLFKTLNRGFDEARAPLVRIWSHDDVMLPGSLAEFLHFMDRYPSVGMLYCDFLAIDGTGRRTGRETLFENQRERTPDVSDRDLSALLFHCFGCLPGNISTVLMKKEAWRAVGGFITGFQQAPDFDMWVKVSRKFDVGFLRSQSIELREHEAQLGRVGQKQMTTIDEEREVHQHLCEYLRDTLSPEEFWNYFTNNRGRQHIHWVMRALLRGDIRVAHYGWSAVKQYGRPYAQFMAWLLSANGHLRRCSGEKLFDTVINRRKGHIVDANA